MTEQGRDPGPGLGRERDPNEPLDEADRIEILEHLRRINRELGQVFALAPTLPELAQIMEKNRQRIEELSNGK